MKNLLAAFALAFLFISTSCTEDITVEPEDQETVFKKKRRSNVITQ